MICINKMGPVIHELLPQTVYVGSRVGKCYAIYLIIKDDIRVLEHSTNKKWHTILTVLWISLTN
jgi:hypothetical protein